MKRSTCAYCGKPVPREGPTTKHYDPSVPGYWRVEPNPRAGEPNVSGHMSAIDPKGYFCTMRCAAIYAVTIVRELRHTDRSKT